MKLGQGFVELGLKQGALKSGLAQAKQMLGGWFAAIGSGYAFRAAIGAAVEEQAANARLEGVIRATGMAAGFTAGEMRRLADAMADATRFTDEEAKSAAAVLLTFKSIRGDEFKRTLAVAGDLAEVLGSDMRSAAVQLGKALEDPKRGLTALRRSGVSFTEAEKEMITGLVESGRLLEAQGIILEALEGQVGGVAAEMNRGAAGGVARFSKAVRELGQDLGTSLAPGAEGAGYVVNALVTDLRLGAGVIADWWHGISYYDRIWLDNQEKKAAAARKLAAAEKLALQEREAAWAAFVEADDERAAKLVANADKVRKRMAGQLTAMQAQVRMLEAAEAGEGAERRARAQQQFFLDLMKAMRVAEQGAGDLARKMEEAAGTKYFYSMRAIRRSEAAEAAEAARAQEEALSHTARGLTDFQAQAHVESLRAGGLDKAAAAAEINDWLAQRVQALDEWMRERQKAGSTTLAQDRAERDRLIASAQQVAEARKQALGEAGDVGHRVASLREIGLAAQGKLPGQQGDKREGLTAAQTTAKNTTRLVQLFKDGALVGSATYQ